MAVKYDHFLFAQEHTDDLTLRLTAGAKGNGDSDTATDEINDFYIIGI